MCTHTHTHIHTHTHTHTFTHMNTDTVRSIHAPNVRSIAPTHTSSGDSLCHPYSQGLGLGHGPGGLFSNRNKSAAALVLRENLLRTAPSVLENRGRSCGFTFRKHVRRPHGVLLDYVAHKHKHKHKQNWGFESGADLCIPLTISSGAS